MATPRKPRRSVAHLAQPCLNRNGHHSQSLRALPDDRPAIGFGASASARQEAGNVCRGSAPHRYPWFVPGPQPQDLFGIFLAILLFDVEIRPDKSARGALIRFGAEPLLLLPAPLSFLNKKPARLPKKRWRSGAFAPIIAAAHICVFRGPSAAALICAKGRQRSCPVPVWPSF